MNSATYYNVHTMFTLQAIVSEMLFIDQSINAYFKKSYESKQFFTTTLQIYKRMFYKPMYDFIVYTYILCFKMLKKTVAIYLWRLR